MIQVAFGSLLLGTPWGDSLRHEAEIRVYLADKKKPLDPTGLEVALEIGRADSPRKRLEADLAKPKGTNCLGIGRGGDVIDAGGLYVELVVFDPHTSPPDPLDGTPYFVPDFAVTPASSFEATVTLKLKGETRTIKGFEFPPLVPRTYAEAVVKLEALAAKVEEGAKARNNEAVRGTLPRVTRLCSGIQERAVEAKKAPVVKACQEVVAVLAELEKTLQTERPVVGQALFDRLRGALFSLKNL